MNCHPTELHVQPSISINSGLPENPSQQSDADFTAVGIRYREASLTLDHIKMLAPPKGPENPNFFKRATNSRCETRCRATTKLPLRRFP